MSECMQRHHLEVLMETYLRESKYTKKTLKDYRIAFKYFILYLEEEGIVHAKTSDVLRYREHRRMLGHSSHYIYVHISALRGFYRYLKIHRKRFQLPELYDHDIMVEVKNERIKPQIKKPVLTIKEAKQLLLRTKDCRKYLWHYRDHAIIYLMLTSGLRSIEIVHAKRRDLQVLRGRPVLYLRRGSQKKEEDFVKIAKGAKQAIDEYLCMRSDDNPYLFVSHKKVSPSKHLSRMFFIYMFKRVSKDAGLESLGLTPHCLRHTAAVLNLQRGASISETKELMRHKNIQSTLVYQDYLSRMMDDSEAQIEAFILKEEAWVLDANILWLLEVFSYE